MVPAELLKRPIGDKRVHDSQSASRNPGLYLGHGYAKKVCCPFPGVCVIPICQGRRDFFNGGGVKRCTNLVAEYCQGACRYARIAHFQYADSDEPAEPGASHTKSCLQSPQRPSVSDLSTDPECSKPAANGAFGTAKPPSNLCRWFVSSQFQQLAIVRRCPWHGGRPSDWTRSPGYLCPGGLALCGTRKFSSFPQISDPLPTIFTGPSRNKLKDAVDRITLLRRSLLDPGNQQLIDRSQLLARLVTLSSRSTGHCATSLQADRDRELASRDDARCAGREQYSRSIQSEVGCGYQSGSTFVVPHLFPWTKERMILSWAESTPSLHLLASDCRCSWRPLGCCFAKRRCSVRCLLPHTN